MSEKPKAVPSWWQTIPGILTGVAAIITAVTGLIVVVNRAGGRAEERVSPASQSVPGGPASGSRGPSPSSDATSRGDAQSVALPALNRVRLAGGDAVITILSAQVEPIDAERRSLKFLVRHLNAGRYDANFWSSSYRLIVDGVPRAPTNLLDEVVAGNSAKEGEVVFEVPVSAKDVVLQISFGEEASRLPFKLP